MEKHLEQRLKESVGNLVAGELAANSIGSGLAGASSDAARQAHGLPSVNEEEAEALVFIARMVEMGELDPIDGIDLCGARRDPA
jgi:hypothetical protein